MIARAVITGYAAADAPLSRATAGWHARALGPVAIVTPPEVPVIEAGDTVVIGRLFRRGVAVAAVSPSLAQAIAASDGRVLVDDHCGSYLALWRDRRDGAVMILREPSGAVPLYRAGQGPTAMLFTDLDDVWPLPHAADVDWTGLTHRLLYPQLPTARTALADVTAVLPGEAVRVDGRDPPHLLWSPWRFAGRAAKSASFAASATAVREAVDSATAALIPTSPVLLELSGGLDSSILAASLDAAGANWAAVTVATPAADGDERRYARAVADHFGVRLETLRLTPGDLDLLAAPRVRTPSPTGFGMLAGVDRAIAAVAARDGAGLISGIGGDNVFCSLRSPAPILDAWRDRGLAHAILTAGDLVRLTDSDYWTALIATVRYAARDRRHPDRWTTDASLLMHDRLPARARHPWLATAVERRAGRRAHVAMILRAHGVANAHGRARIAAMQLPLLAQPVVETCLAIPTWHWIAGGRDRAVARAAFADRLPSLITARRGKGRLESLLAPAFNRDRAELCDRLANGHLVAAGIVDRNAIISAFAMPASALDDVYIRLLELADAEFWLDGRA